MRIDSDHPLTSPPNGDVQVRVHRDGVHEQVDLDYEDLWRDRDTGRVNFLCHDHAGHSVVISLREALLMEAVFPGSGFLQSYDSADDPSAWRVREGVEWQPTEPKPNGYRTLPPTDGTIPNGWDPASGDD
jgi:hypothetical protein